MFLASIHLLTNPGFLVAYTGLVWTEYHTLVATADLSIIGHEQWRLTENIMPPALASYKQRVPY